MTAESITIPALLARRSAKSPDLEAIVGDDASISYRDLDDRTISLAARLASAGVHKGARVGLIMPNGIDWAVAGLAVMRVGAVLVPLSTLLRPAELSAQLRVSAVSHLITVPTHRGRHYLDDLEAVEIGRAHV